MFRCDVPVNNVTLAVNVSWFNNFFGKYFVKL